MVDIIAVLSGGGGREWGEVKQYQNRNYLKMAATSLTLSSVWNVRNSQLKKMWQVN